MNGIESLGSRKPDSPALAVPGPYNTLAEYYLTLGDRFMTLFDNHAQSYERPSDIDISRKRAPLRLERLVQVKFTADKRDDPINVNLNLHGDYIVFTEGANKAKERLNCLSAHCWSKDWVEGEHIGEIANPRVTVGSLVNHNKAPEQLAALEKSILIAEAVVIEQTPPDLAILL
jgi:hypothetical protein